jgi:hypothetical protein
LLLYAGGASLLGTTPEWLHGLLDATTVANLPGGRRAAAAAAPGFAVQGTPTPVVDSGRYLGVPTRGASLPDLNPAKGFSTKVEAVSQRVALVRKLFSVRTRGKSSVNLDFPLLSTLVKQQVFQRFVVPSPVVRVDTDAFGVRLRRDLKPLLGLPRAHVPVGLTTLPTGHLAFSVCGGPPRNETRVAASPPVLGRPSHPKCLAAEGEA